MLNYRKFKLFREDTFLQGVSDIENEVNKFVNENNCFVVDVKFSASWDTENDIVHREILLIYQDIYNKEKGE